MEPKAPFEFPIMALSDATSGALWENKIAVQRCRSWKEQREKEMGIGRNLQNAVSPQPILQTQPKPKIEQKNIHPISMCYDSSLTAMKSVCWFLFEIKTDPDAYDICHIFLLVIHRPFLS